MLNRRYLLNFIFHKLSVDTNLESASGKATYITKVKNLLRDMKALVLKEMLEKDLFLRVGASSSSSAPEIKKVYPNANVSYVTEVSEIPNGPTVPTETYEDMIQNLSLY